MVPLDEDIESVISALKDTLAWSKTQGYRGYNKHDGLNSPVLRLLLGWSKWSRLVAIQSVMRSPINLRPALLVPKSYNPKGMALFIQALLDLYKLSDDTQYLHEAEKLLELLLNIRSPGTWSGICWGYHYPWQDAGFYAPTNTPNAVVTSFVCEAFLAAYKVTGKSKYLEIVDNAIDFFLNDLIVLKDSNEERCLSYMPLPMNMRVIDVSILIGSVITQFGILAKDTKNYNTAKRLIHYVANLQTDYGAWYYTDPPGDSFIKHDNYHRLS